MTPGENIQAVHFDAGDVRIEGRLSSGDGGRAVVVTHPHPLYGGDMDNSVVAAIARAYNEKGWSALRFNFRGTGGSRGHFDDGRGEQTDLQAAVDWLRARGVHTIDLAGYSFGTWVMARWARGASGHGHRIRFVAPPVAFMDFGDIDRIEGLDTVIVGSRDDFAPLAAVESKTGAWSPTADLKVVDGADHFFMGHLETLTAMLRDRIDRGVPDQSTPAQPTS
jgi:alpha/beta superfamily hydrolase